MNMRRPPLHHVRLAISLAFAVLMTLVGVDRARAQPPGPSAAAASPAVPQRTVGEWLLRMHEASRKRAYIGTFVVSSAAGNMSSARIWHVCDGEQQMERVESLTGTPRSTFRHNDKVVTFLPESKVARTEQRETLGLFPNMLRASDSPIGEFYVARQTGSDRVAGFDADVVQITPKDGLRFGYRIWSEKKSGLVVKLQTLDADSRVLEQAAFSELQLDAPVRMDKLHQMMANTDGYRVEKSEPVKTTALAEGWTLSRPVAGFQPVSCYRRPGSSQGASSGTLQWIFTDGLASVSLFVEPYDARRHAQEMMAAMGATHALARRLDPKGGDWWLTVVGEVPPSTLKAFAESIERAR